MQCSIWQHMQDNDCQLVANVFHFVLLLMVLYSLVLYILYIINEWINMYMYSYEIEIWWWSRWVGKVWYQCCIVCFGSSSSYHSSLCCSSWGLSPLSLSLSSLILLFQLYNIYFLGKDCICFIEFETFISSCNVLVKKKKKNFNFLFKNNGIFFL